MAGRELKNFKDVPCHLAVTAEGLTEALTCPQMHAFSHLVLELVVVLPPHWSNTVTTHSGRMSTLSILFLDKHAKESEA